MGNYEAAGGEEDAEAAPATAPKRARKESRICPGKSVAEPCMFSREKKSIGRPAQLATGKRRCQFCDAAALATAAKDKFGKRHMTRALRAWAEAGRQDIADAAMARIPAEDSGYFEQALQHPSRTAQGKVTQAKAKGPKPKPGKWPCRRLWSIAKLAGLRCRRKSVKPTGEKWRMIAADCSASLARSCKPEKRRMNLGDRLWQPALRSGAASIPGWPVRNAIAWWQGL